MQAVGLGNHGERGKRRHDGVAIGFGARDVCVSDPAARTALVLDDGVPPELLGQVRRERAGRYVCGASRRKRDDDRDGPGRPCALRLRAAGCSVRKRKRRREL